MGKSNCEVQMSTTEGKQIIQTDRAPRAIGPYSQAIRIQDLVFTAGQVGLIPKTGELIAGGIREQARRCS